MRLWPRAALVGLLAALALGAFYLGVLTILSGWGYARDQLVRDAPYLVVLVPMFGAQVGLYAWMRHATRASAATATTAASGGMSGAGMVACCAHFLPTILPYTGVAALATLVTDWRTPMLLFAIGANAAGILVVTRAIRRARRHHATMIQENPA